MTTDPLAVIKEQAIDQIDWYMNCLNNVIDGRPVRGLAEAEAGYEDALKTFAALVERLEQAEAALRWYSLDKRIGYKARDYFRASIPKEETDG